MIPQMALKRNQMKTKYASQKAVGSRSLMGRHTKC